MRNPWYVYIPANNESMLLQRWSTVYDAGPTFEQQLHHRLMFAGSIQYSKQETLTQCWFNAGPASH